MKWFSLISLFIIGIFSVNTGLCAGDVYLLRLVNNHELLVRDLKINPETERVSCRGEITRLKSSFPLERLFQVVSINLESHNIGLGPVLYTNTDSILNVPEDGGIPANFFITSTSVGSSGGGGRNQRSTKGTSSRNRSFQKPSSRGTNNSSRSNSSKTSGKNPFAQFMGGG